MIKVPKVYKIFREWIDDLLPEEVNALDDAGYGYSDANISAGEVLDVIVMYYGGLSSAYRIKSIISRVYGVELE